MNIIDALDDLSSLRSSVARRSRALTALERYLARVCIPSEGREEKLKEFRRLQDTFELNMASRILTFLCLALSHLQQSSTPVTSPVFSIPATPSHTRDHTPRLDPASLAALVTQSLGLLQGMALLHKPSQVFLARKANLQLFLDLLSLSRPTSHAGLGSSSSSSVSQMDRNVSGQQCFSSPIPLSPLTAITPIGPTSVNAGSPLPLAVLDTLLCILVDSPCALRAFEDANGLEVIVRTLKRAGVPRDVRMKCLEFLYFYLLPETPSSPATHASPPVEDTEGIDAPSPYIAAPTTSTASGFTRAAKHLAPPTPATHNFSVPSLSSSRSSSPSDLSDVELPSPSRRQHRNAREELERFVPVTPRKVKVARIGLGTPRQAGGDIPALSLSTPSKAKAEEMRGLGFGLLGHEREAPTRIFGQQESDKGEAIRTTEEKKERLGAWLGNVDQLVEGVRKAGVWGIA